RCSRMRHFLTPRRTRLRPAPPPSMPSTKRRSRSPSAIGRSMSRCCRSARPTCSTWGAGWLERRSGMTTRARSTTGSSSTGGAHRPGRTRAGTRIEVFANLGSVKEAARAVELGAEGVGLLRTEFLFLDRAELPGEEEQAETLRQIARALDGRPLVVRTLDAGADKPLRALPMPAEANPFLGVRGLRLGLRQPEVLS